MASHSRILQTPSETSFTMSAPPGPSRRVISSHTARPNKRTAFSSPAPRRNSQTPYPTSSGSSRSRATATLGSHSTARDHESSNPLFVRGTRPSVNLPSSSGRLSRVTSSRPSSRVYESSPPPLRRVARPGFALPSSSGRQSNTDYNSEGGGLGRGVNDIHSEEDDDAVNEVIMAIDMREHGSRGSSLGCAYFVALEQTLYLLEDVAMATVDLVETLLLHAQPTTVLISARAPEALAQFLERGSQDVNGNRGETLFRGRSIDRW